MSRLNTGDNVVESPFIIMDIGGFTFGKCAKAGDASKLGSTFKITYPNFMKSLNIVKVNGSLNQYTINLEYAITQYDDPNLIDQVLATVSDTRKLKLTYGDWMMPAYIYREEEAIITKVTSNVDMASSRISYTINATSTALSLNSGSQTFPAKNTKPSDELKSLIKNNTSGISQILYGMRDMGKVISNNLIASNDKKVQLMSKTCSTLNYISYLVNSMQNNNDSSNAAVGGSTYFLTIHDDNKNMLGGPYFEVKEASADTVIDSYDTYAVDIGYPSDNFVSNFTIKNDDSWAILYKAAQAGSQPEYTYSIDNDGKIVTSFSPSITTSSKYYTTTTLDKSWWTKVTQFPIQATITIRGLLRPAMLMQYVRANVYFYGKKHSSSGLYIITRQEDQINDYGYKTTLSLLRIKGDA